MSNIPLLSSFLQNRRGQILLPAVMLAPIFILVVYLLFETSKLSMTKVRQQFALDNAAYSQMSSTSGYLNAVAQVNGPLPYRVMKTFDTVLEVKQSKAGEAERKTIFDVFYEAGAFPAIGPNHGKGEAINNPSPAPESTDWNFQYFKGKRKNWNKADPTQMREIDEKDDQGKDKLKEHTYAINTFSGADDYFFVVTDNGPGMVALKEYLTIFIRTGSIYASQTYVYKDTVKKSRMFRDSYFLNTRDCRRADCGKQAAHTLERYILETKPFEISDVRVYFSAVSNGYHQGAVALDMPLEEWIKSKLFQFAYLTPNSRSRLKQLKHGVHLKQKFSLPQNHFNINLVERFHPYVRNTVYVSCPRNTNNCVWPNPLSKYSVKVGI